MKTIDPPTNAILAFCSYSDCFKHGSAVSRNILNLPSCAQTPSYLVCNSTVKVQADRLP